MSNEKEIQNEKVVKSKFKFIKDISIVKRINIDILDLDYNAIEELKEIARAIFKGNVACTDDNDLAELNIYLKNSKRVNSMITLYLEKLKEKELIHNVDNYIRISDELYTQKGGILVATDSKDIESKFRLRTNLTKYKKVFEEEQYIVGEDKYIYIKLSEFIQVIEFEIEKYVEKEPNKFYPVYKIHIHRIKFDGEKLTILPKSPYRDICYYPIDFLRRTVYRAVSSNKYFPAVILNNISGMLIRYGMEVGIEMDLRYHHHYKQKRKKKIVNTTV